MVWGLVVCFLVALALAAAALNRGIRKNALADSEARITRFMAGAEAALNRALLGFDVLLASTDDLLGLSFSPSGWLDSPSVSLLLRSAARQNLMVRYVALLDGRGRVLASSDPAGTRLAVELPAGFLRTAMEQPVSSLVVSAPMVSFASSERVLYVARHLRMGDGSRLLAVAQVPTAMLVSVLMQSVDIEGLEVTLERSGGELLISAPVPTEAQSIVHSASRASLVEGQRWNQFARITQLPAFVAIHPILYQDLWISASLPVSAALAGSSSERMGVLIAALLFATMVVATGALMQNHLVRMNAARQMIAQSKATLDQALGSMVSGFLLLDARHCVAQWNRRYEQIFPGLMPAMVRGMPFRAVLEATARSHLPGASESERVAWVERRLQQQAHPDGTHEQWLPSGHVIQITERPTPEGGLVITYHDVTDLRRASAEIESLAFYDPLTGLPNRRLLLDRLGQATMHAVRSGHMGALLFLDLEHFKVLNDTLGHEVGDQLLQQVARRLKEAVRSSDTVARLGGDEFVIILGELSSERCEAAIQAQRIGEKILHGLNRPYALGGQTHRGGCSIGAALFEQGSQPMAELLKQADIAMYQVKAQRGNALCFFDPQMQIEINHRARLESDLQVALAEGQFELHYQPQFTLGGELVGAEALLRWHHPQRGLVPPSEFIAVAEDRSLIMPLGLWVLCTACQQLAAWQNDPRCMKLQMSVNVSALQFRQPDFAERVIGVLQQTGARSHLLTLELTESLVLDDVQDSIAKMHLLRTKGVRFSMDDFGTGHSSLAYLTRLPLHQLKIDQSFVRNLGLRHTDDVIVQTIIGMARALELEVIAEGVETAQQRDFLANHGCDLYQGYLFGRPMPVAGLEVLLSPLGQSLAGQEEQ
ncbi:diguanylate cyclase (GGDEF) domain-containing protein [Delftia lacustris]|uniref:Diguanylate cyclase (GGDEF) domain-containing protein n=2 Tax=Delftia lacustris TaxID=558537 RepID=A0A1H3SHU6_9BURK|nr:diguanylate cyclase (GGDEF) domain-containing protein [Delftia lacustris]